MSSVEFEVVDIENPDQLNLIFGQSHFIKTVEDLYEVSEIVSIWIDDR